MSAEDTRHPHVNQDRDEIKEEQFKNDLGEVIVPGFPEFHQLRNLVSSANHFVLNLEKCSDVFLRVISSIKKHLRRANVLVATLEKAQRETVLKMLDIKWQDAAVQVSPKAPELKRHSKRTQSSCIEEVLMYMVLVSKELEPATSSLLEDGIGSDLSESTLLTQTTEGKNDNAENEEEENNARVNPTENVLKAKFKRNKKIRNRFLLVFFVLLLLDGALAYVVWKEIGRKDSINGLKQTIITTFENFVSKCPTLPTIRDGEPTCGVVKDLRATRFSRNIFRCIFKCNYGYKISSKTPVRCLGKQKWNSSAPICTETPCYTVKDRDCANLARLGRAGRTGVYTITQCGIFEPVQVYCDFDTEGGGWTAIQRRMDSRTNFTRTYSEYEYPFGNGYSSYWIGLKTMNHISVTEAQMLMIVLTDWFYPRYHYSKAYAVYNNFQVENGDKAYRLQVTDFQVTSYTYENAGNSLVDSNGMQFTAADADHDWNEVSNCAVIMNAGWWHKNCTAANLNAPYSNHPTHGRTTIHWRTWRKYSSLRSVEMFIRPRDWSKK